MSRWIRQRLAMTSSAANQAGKVVYLAECRYDLRTERANLRDELARAGWQVRPDPAQAARTFAEDLRESLAFVQLLESYPREDDSHRAQLAQATPAVPCFRFRHAKIQPDQAEEAHREFLSELMALIVERGDYP